MTLAPTQPTIAPRPLAAVAEMMGRLRTVETTADLLARAPREIARVGYDRCMVSRVHKGRWIAQSAWVRDDADLAQAMTSVGEEPVVLTRGLLESELVRTRAPMIVRDAQRNPRTHRRLIDVTGTHAYVAAPIQVEGTVVGFVHVDSNRHTGSVDDADLEVLGLVGECLGFALERAISRERLRAVRESLVARTSSLLEIIDDPDPDLARGGTTLGGSALGGLALGGPAPEGPSSPRPAGSHLDTLLTPRELEVLEHVATGRGNVAIASALFVTEATVKAHVKHIFRKLGVANRAEAVSRYLRG